ncbi:hypothetical protein H5410_050319 [Solanum commersonii]|uniref:DUF7588 domain-containing protein n=1 Tax=Solanum commersonii TaxID=4109 RepID=A0A9J5WX90_SOLCO|nr:hypothetical protein H5410_050319 [Solanum commersonii]
MNVHQIDFSPGSLARKYIQNEFASDKWSQFKTWFFDTYSAEDLHNISQEFYETCALRNIIKAIYYPQAPFILPNNTGITFTAFQKFIENDVATVSINEINNLISQNNYLGLYVKIKSDLKPSEQAFTSKQPDILPTHIQRPPEI